MSLVIRCHKMAFYFLFLIFEKIDTPYCYNDVICIWWCCNENFPNQMRCLHFCQFLCQVTCWLLRSFKFHCFRTLISTQLIVIRCCHTVLNIIFNYLLRGVARPLFSMYYCIFCIELICTVKDKLKPVRSDLLQVVIFPDLDHKRKYYRRRRIAKLIGEKP